MEIESDQEIFSLVGNEDIMIETLVLSAQDSIQQKIFNSTMALEYISQRIRVSKFYDSIKKSRNLVDEAVDIISSFFINLDILIPHVPCKQFDYKPKALFISLMIRQLLLVKKDPSLVDDKDYYGNKRLESAGQLMGLLFEDKLKIFNSELKKEIDRFLTKQQGKEKLPIEILDVSQLMRKSDLITNGFIHALSTGNWKLKRFKMERAGVTQVLSKLSYIASLGMMTRITSQFEKTRKISGPRALQGSHWGIICPSDTPDGESCGLIFSKRTR